MILVLYLSIVNPDRRYLPEWLLVIVNAGIYLTAFGIPLTFYYSADGAWIPGPLRNTCLFVSIFLLGELIYLTVRKYRGIQKRNMLMPIFSIVMIIGSLIMDYETTRATQTVSFLTIAIVVSSLIYYIWLHLQFVREHEEDLKAQQRIRIMISQIQPHFLFNVLSTIQAMCDTQPQMAKQTLGKLGLYLRQNIDSLNQTELIPFEKELEHTRIYADIEMERFENILVEYDTPDTGFFLPALTIQPMVENAIRHGIRNREQGIVSVITREKENYHEIIIRDNGIGFDARQTLTSDGDHIGFVNTMERIKSLCHGSVSIDSRIGEGTQVVIRIPNSDKEAVYGRQKME